MRNTHYDDDDGRVIADMGDVERQPMLIPRFGGSGGSGGPGRYGGFDGAGGSGRRSERKDLRPSVQEPGQERDRRYEQQPEYIPPETRRAMIGGAVTAGLLIAVIFALAFGALIYFIGH